MAIHTIRVFGDPVLKRPTAPVTDIDGALVKLVDAMYDTMYDAPGVGLAAPAATRFDGRGDRRCASSISARPLTRFRHCARSSTRVTRSRSSSRNLTVAVRAARAPIPLR